jgi:SMC interacting uncharacterized protein involved in chromosome segregation
MSVALKLVEQLADAANDEMRFRLIAEAIGQLEEALPCRGEIASPHDVREAELRLQREIEIVRKEIESVRREIEVMRGENKDMELRLQREIRELELRLQKEIREVELRLLREIKQVELQVQEVRVEVEQVRVELEQVRVEVKATEVSLRTAIHRQTLWVIGAVGSVVGLIRVLEWLFP